MTSYGRYWEAIRFDTVSREGATPPHRSPQANTWIPRGSSGTSMASEGVGLEGEGMATGGTVQWPTSPPWADAEVSCLLSMFTAGMRMGTPE